MTEDSNVENWPEWKRNYRLTRHSNPANFTDAQFNKAMGRHEDRFIRKETIMDIAFGIVVGLIIGWIWP